MNSCISIKDNYLSKKTKKTHEQYVAELAVKNPTVVVTESYRGAKVKIKHHCLLHDVYWDITPNDALRGQGCNVCHTEKISNRLKITQDEYVKELAQKNPTIELVGAYNGKNTKTKFHCLIHPEEYWECTANNGLQGIGCKKCKSEDISQRMRRSPEEYIEELHKIHPFIDPVQDYITATIPITHYCNKHKVEWDEAPNTLLHGIGCPECLRDYIARSRRLSNEEYIDRLKKNNPNVIPLDDYINSDTKIRHLHKECGHITMMTPESALHGNGCNICVGNKISRKNTKSHENFVSEINSINPYLLIRGQYKNYYTPIETECLICHYIWNPMAGYLSEGTGCPVCNEPIGERKIRIYLDKNNIEYIKGYKFDQLRGINNGQLSYDFYVPYYNTLIEFQGMQHYQPIDFFGGTDTFEIQREHDDRKANYAIVNRYNYLVLSYKDIDNINDILDTFFNNLKLETVETTGIV